MSILKLKMFVIYNFDLVLKTNGNLFNYKEKGKFTPIFLFFQSHKIFKSLLHLACEDSNFTLVIELLERHDIDVNKSDKDVNTEIQLNQIRKTHLFVFNVLFYSITGMGE